MTTLEKIKLISVLNTSMKNSSNPDFNKVIRNKIEKVVNQLIK